MIPKIIHYCWFGRRKMPPLAVKYIKSWKTHLPDYEFKLWNEDNFDLNCHPYVKEAYAAKKYAFVTDYVRLWVLYHFGGIYLDTDVEVIKNFDNLLSLPAFTGFESEVDVPTGIMASEASGKWVTEQLGCYQGRHFIMKDGDYDLTTNAQTISKTMADNGFVLKNSFQIYQECVHIFPKDYFCPKSRTGIITITENTYCIHHFAGSWYPLTRKIRRYFFGKILGPYITDFLVKKKKLMKNKLLK